MFQIGPYEITAPTILAPMAGVTDRPFRQLCREMGAGLAVSEMVASNEKLRNTRKSQLRLDHAGEDDPRSVQILGNDPQMMAQAARLNAEQGAQIIDINMGCPAKKVCNKAAGSALMRDEALVAEILQAVVAAVDIPVTLKIRTGWSLEERNALRIAKIAEDSGIAALAVHGRTRACAYRGEAEYEHIAQIKQAINIPLFANGDICSARKAKFVLDYTQADAVMIGRAAQGRPWIFREINHFLECGEQLAPPSLQEVEAILLRHLAQLHEFYGDYLGPRIARKHVGWYLSAQDKGQEFRQEFFRIEDTDAQIKSVQAYFERLINNEEIAA